MSARRCGQCGYDLSGLPTAGTVVTCPECEHLTDLAIPLSTRVNVVEPFLWAMVPVTLGGVALAFDLRVSRSVAGSEGFFVAAGVLGGAITAGVLTYKATRHAPEMGGAPHGWWPRLVFSVIAMILAVVMGAIAMFWVVALLLIAIRFVRG